MSLYIYVEGHNEKTKVTKSPSQFKLKISKEDAIQLLTESGRYTYGESYRKGKSSNDEYHPEDTVIDMVEYADSHKDTKNVFQSKLSMDVLAHIWSYGYSLNEKASTELWSRIFNLTDQYYKATESYKKDHMYAPYLVVTSAD